MREATKAVRGRPPAFNRNDIVDCALAVLTRHGVEALTLRGIARELGTVLGTVNYHFDNLADLEDAVAARLMGQLPVLDAARPEPLREQLVELGLALIEINSTHPYVRHIIGPIGTEIVARQLRQDWATLQSLGLSEDAAMLCMEVVQSLARGRGNELHRLRSGGEPVLRLSEELWKKVGKEPLARLSVASFTAKKMEPVHRALLGTTIDIFLRGLGIEPAAATKTDVKYGKDRK